MGSTNSSYTTQDAPNLLLKYYYLKRNPQEIEAFVKQNKSVSDLIRAFFNDQHTYYDTVNEKEFEKYALEHLKPKSFSEPRILHKRKYIYLYVGTFVGLFNKPVYRTLKEQYQSTIRNAVAESKKRKLPLWIDLSKNEGGDETVMIQPFRLLSDSKIPQGVVQVSGMTNSAGEMLAATLIYDYNFIRVGPRTSGSLSISKNFVLDNGKAFLGVTTGPYTTPAGNLINQFYL